MGLMAAQLPVQVPPEALEAFCRKWKIVRLEAFGAVLRDDFGPESDIDLLATLRRTRSGACLIWREWNSS